MYQDRGKMKWRGMMLTEHTKQIDAWQESVKQSEKPQLDDFELELLADEIERAYKSNSSIKLTYWRAGYLDTDYGKVIEINTTNKSIVIDDPFSTNRYPFDEIVSVTLIA